ncbi:MAG: ATP synthase gamma chain, sodium ion specific [Gemmatimonadaceae bacterium]|nr:ATP synthase gamma chain, sodium ion specific [Gemmatimonadaceae bacterium]
MAKGKELKARIRTTESTRKITRTMEMVATSKLKRALDRVQAARPYANALGDVISSLYTPELAERFPLLRQPEQERRAAVLLMTADRGLCGGFNANLIREARHLVERLRDRSVEVELHFEGRRGVGYFRYIGEPVTASRIGISERPTADDASALIDGIMRQFIDGTLDAVYVVYAQFKSPLSTPPTASRILPVTPPARTAGGTVPDYILAPSADAIVSELLPLYVRNQVYRALVETAAGEQGARRSAMKSATDNATDMLSLLRRTYNRTRQASITQEIAEIVGGAAALE